MIRQKIFLPIVICLVFVGLSHSAARAQDAQTGEQDTLLLPPLLLESIAGDVCICVEGIAVDRMRAEVDQEVEACFTVTLVENFEDLEAYFGHRIFNGTRLNLEIMEQIGTQLGERLLISCPAFTRLIR